MKYFNEIVIILQNRTYSFYHSCQTKGVHDNTRGKILSWEYRSPRKRNSRPPASVILCSVSWVENALLIYYAPSDLFVCLHWKNPRFTAFLDSNLHTRLAIVTENELGLAFPPRNHPKKFRPVPSTFYLVIVVTNRQTDKPTPVKT